MKKRKALIETRTMHKKTKYDDKYDLSDFPDDILVQILSLLPLKNAVATTTLSSRWRYLWRLITSLNFDVEDDLSTSANGAFHVACDAKYPVKKRRRKFIKWANSVLDQHLGDIASFRVCFFLTHTHRDSINKWINFAMKSQKLEKLELDFTLSGGYTRDVHYSFSHHREKYEYVDGFKSLKVISLKSVSVSGEDVEYLLANALVLERLAVHDSPSLVHLRVCGGGQQQPVAMLLKHLEITGCENLISVEICELVNLVSLCFDGYIGTNNSILRDVPLLVELHLDFTKRLCNFKQLFSSCLHQIEVLRMVHSFTGDIATRYYDVCYPRLPNLKQLHMTHILDLDRIWCANYDDGLVNLRLLIKAFPNLERLVLHVPRQSEDEYLEKRFQLSHGKSPKSPHDCLKEVEILEYNGKCDDMELVVHLINNCVALQKIVINCNYVHRRSRPTKTKQQLLEDEQFSRMHAMTQLRTKVPSNIEFVCI